MNVRSEFNTEDPQILGAAVRNLLSMTICRPGFVYPAYKNIVFL